MGTIIPRKRKKKKNKLRKRIVYELEMDTWEEPISMQESNRFSLESLQIIASAIEADKADEIRKQQEKIAEELDKTQAFMSEIYGLGINTLKDIYGEILYKKGLLDSRVLIKIQGRHSG